MVVVVQTVERSRRVYPGSRSCGAVKSGLPDTSSLPELEAHAVSSQPLSLKLQGSHNSQRRSVTNAANVSPFDSCVAKHGNTPTHSTDAHQRHGRHGQASCRTLL